MSFGYFTEFFILILRHDVKNVCFKFRYSLCKIYQNMGLIWSVFSRLQFCPYTGKYGYDSTKYTEKYGSEKACISVYFTQWLEKMTVFYYTDFTIFKFSFFQRLIVIGLLVSETIKKKLSKLRPPKTIFFPPFSFCRQWVIAKANPWRCSEKRLIKNILQNPKGKTW